MASSFRFIAAPLVIAALAAPAMGSAAGSGNPTLRNDETHFRAPPPANGSSAPVVVEVDAGFDWAAAGVGAAGGLGLVLVAGGAVSVVRRRSPVDEAHA